MSGAGRILLGAAGGLYVLLGVVHAVLVLRDLRVPRTFTPPDPALRLAMQESSVAINPAANLWRAWLGFNISHSVGLLVFGSVLATVAIQRFRLFAGSWPLNAAAIVVAAIYVVLGKVFWFRDPLIGASLGLACVVAASIIS
jgi:hypothetical protein